MFIKLSYQYENFDALNKSVLVVDQFCGAESFLQNFALGLRTLSLFYQPLFILKCGIICIQDVP